MGTVHDIYNSTYLSVCCALQPVLPHRAGPDATSDISLLPGFLVLLMECIIGRHECIIISVHVTDFKGVECESIRVD